MNTFIRYRTSILSMLLQIYCFYRLTVFRDLLFLHICDFCSTLIFLFFAQIIISYFFMDRMISHVIFDGSRKFHYKRPIASLYGVIDQIIEIHHFSNDMISNFKIYIFSNVKMKI